MVDFEKVKVQLENLKNYLFKPIKVNIISSSDFGGVREMVEEIKNLQFKDQPSEMETFDVSANKNHELHNNVNKHWPEFFNSRWYKNSNNS